MEKNFTIDQAKLSGNTTDVEYLQGLTEKVQSGAMLTPRHYVRKYGGAARLIDANADMANGLLFGPEYNLLDRIRYNRGVSYVQENFNRASIQKTSAYDHHKTRFTGVFYNGRIRLHDFHELSQNIL
ncbi:hypothetical protein [Paenibacillus thiaminolyticus]|uniref:hypothetical protein n=1 Tax=Paenibacillus thiaminolyticus TaxID=49283 RepID=UPI00197E85F9|nr:hypothetical protein [Paenibacillus thiaminolyticus]